MAWIWYRLFTCNFYFQVNLLQSKVEVSIALSAALIAAFSIQLKINFWEAIWISLAIVELAWLEVRFSAFLWGIELQISTCKSMPSLASYCVHSVSSNVISKAMKSQIYRSTSSNRVNFNFYDWPQLYLEYSLIFRKGIRSLHFWDSITGRLFGELGRFKLCRQIEVMLRC